MNIRTRRSSGNELILFLIYCSTLLDPLRFGDQSLYKELCESREDDWKSSKLNEVAQSRQEDWFGLWVKEMIRIAKPGAPVIVENVAPPYCDKMSDWGGVEKDFWPRAVEKYGWDVDPNSFSFADDVYTKGRYQVAMRKRGTIR